MRKISLDAAEALMNGCSFSRGNTRVVDRVMYLFNNPIARIEGTNLELSNCGWTSLTTKERLNAILQVFNLNHGCIYQHQGEWFIGKGIVFPYDEWFTIPLLK